MLDQTFSISSTVLATFTRPVPVFSCSISSGGKGKYPTALVIPPLTADDVPVDSSCMKLLLASSGENLDGSLMDGEGLFFRPSLCCSSLVPPFCSLLPPCSHLPTHLDFLHVLSLGCPGMVLWSYLRTAEATCHYWWPILN